MTVLQEPPVRDVTAQQAVAPPVAPVRKAKIWPRIVAVAAVLLAFAVGLGIGLFVVNGDIDSLQDDVASLQTDLRAAQDQLGDLRTDVITLRSGYSLEREHLAQAPGAPISLGNLNEHLAQAPR
jgi:predicted PurR-regulated permease PerM